MPPIHAPAEAPARAVPKARADMAMSTPEYTRADARPLRQLPRERRRHQRVAVNLLGRFMRQNRQEYPCKVLNVSPGGIAFLAPIAGEIGERIVAYIDQIGRIEGELVRNFTGGFAIRIKASTAKRDKLADQLVWLCNRDSLDLPDDRRHHRIVPRNTNTTLTTHHGAKIACQVLDVSLSGASVQISGIFVPIGAQVVLGRMRGRVVRHHDQGIAIEFFDLQQAASIEQQFG